MSSDQPLFIINITRYGLPFVIGVFYCTASLGFEFTSDSTMHVVSFVKYGFGAPPGDGYPSPLWQFLLTLGGWFQLEPLLTSKILSLLFSCLTIFMSYLVANEILRDRLHAFCISLLLGMQGWLLQIAPSGSALNLAIALLMTTLFFMLRNEYVVAPFILGLCTLVFWQAVFVFIPLCADIWINSINKRRASKVIVSAGLVYLGALMPWGLYAWFNTVAAVPVLYPVIELPTHSLLALTVVGFLGFVGAAGFAFSLLIPGTGAESFRAHFGAMLFMITLICSGVVFRLDVQYGALPLVTVYAFFGIASVMKRVGRERLPYNAAFVLTGLLLAQSQFDYNRENKLAMASAIVQGNGLRRAAEWIKMNSSSGESVCADQPGEVEYYAERPVTALAGRPDLSCGVLVVSTRRDIAGYDLMFHSESVPDGANASVHDCAVWRRKR